MNIIKETLKVQNKKIRGKKQTKGVQESKAVQMAYYKKLRLLAKELQREVRLQLMPYLEQNQAKFRTVKDGYSDDLTVIFNNLRDKFSNMEYFARSTASTMVNATDNINRNKLYKSVSNSIGIDMNQVLAEEGLTDFVKAQTQKNATLIKSIPSDFFKDIETIVYNGTTSGKTYAEIAKQISGVKDINSTFGKLNNRIKLIARNETSTINSQITKKRYENLGIEKAIWRTAKDERTRPCHRAREGKEYDLKKGLYSSCDGRTIQVGEEINCRCYAEAVIEFD